MKNLTLLRTTKITLIDDADYNELNQYEWYMNSKGYVARWEHKNGKSKNIFLHRQLLKPRLKEQVDHINHNPLDNRRNNLRIVSSSQNQHNQKRTVGVHFYKPLNKWVAYTKILGKRKHLGYFLLKSDARLAFSDEISKMF